LSRDWLKSRRAPTSSGGSPLERSARGPNLSFSPFEDWGMTLAGFVDLRMGVHHGS
jgi:hypothetical protein